MALNQNILLASNDYVQFGTATTSVPTEEGTDIANITTPDLYQGVVFTPSDTSADIEFKIDLGVNQTLSVLALLKHNINYTGLWRVLLNENESDPVGQDYDSGWVPVNPPQSGFGSLTWGAFVWGGGLPEELLGKYNRHAYCLLPDAVNIRYITIRLRCPGNPEPVKFFRVWGSQGYQPSTNAVYGAEITPIDKTPMFESAQLSRTYGAPIQARSMSCSFDLLPKQELFYNILANLYLVSGTFTPVIVILEPLEPEHFYVAAIFGNFEKIEKSTYNYWGQFGTSFTVEEAV